MIEIQQGDSFILSGTLKDNGVIVPLNDKQIVIDIVGCRGVVVRASNKGEYDVLIVVDENNHLYCKFTKEHLVNLHGDYRILAKVVQDGTQVSSINEIELVIIKNPTGAK